MSYYPPTFSLIGKISRGEWVKINKRINKKIMIYQHERGFTDIFHGVQVVESGKRWRAEW